MSARSSTGNHGKSRLTFDTTCTNDIDDTWSTMVTNDETRLRALLIPRVESAAALRGRVRALAGQHRLSATDISASLGIDLAQVRGMLALTGDEAAEAHRRAWR